MENSHNIAQGSSEWFEARRGKVTASRVGMGRFQRQL